MTASWEDDLMKTMRKALALVLSMVLAVSMLLFSGCGTPATAMTVDGRAVSTGEYLANLFYNFVNGYYQTGLYQYAMYGMDPWGETLAYGEGDETVDMPVADYMKKVTEDAIVRQAAVAKLLEQYGITVPEEELENAKTGAEQLLSAVGITADQTVKLGFNSQYFFDMYTAINAAEPELFYQLYGKGGQKEVPEADIKKYYDEEYVAYKAITMSQLNEDGEKLTDAEIEANRKSLQGYLDQFNADGDMDAVIEKYNVDTTPTTTTAPTTTTTAAPTTTTTAAPTEATTTTTTTTVTTTSTGNTSTTASTTTTNPNLRVITSFSDDEKVVEAFKVIPVGEAQIIEYTDSEENSYLALVYRADIAEAGEIYTFEEQRESCIYGIKYEEFDTDVKAMADSLTVSVDGRAVSMCDPKNFVTDLEKILA